MNVFDSYLDCADRGAKLLLPETFIEAASLILLIFYIAVGLIVAFPFAVFGFVTKE